jgi:hypothetical protein
MKDDFLIGIFAGTLTTLFIVFLIWIFTGEPGMIRKTEDGKYFIRTHWETYELVSDQPKKVGFLFKEEIKD